MKLSIVTTMYESAVHLREFYDRVSASAQRLTPDYEIVFVNDGSPDESLATSVSLCQQDPRVRVVDLSRNFGHHKAMMTGVAHAKGDLIFLIDCDLEEAPELLLEFNAKMRSAGADVVYGVQRKRKGGFIERLGGIFFYAMFDLLANYKMPRNIVTARLMTRRYVDALLLHQEREVFMAGLWSVTGFAQVGVPVDKASNRRTTYTFGRRLAALVNGVTSFSTAPLRYIFYLGSAVMIISAGCGFYLIVHAIFFGSYLPGWASLIVSIWLLGGMMIFCVGVVGIYVAKVFSEAKQRPYTIVRQVYEHQKTRPASNELR